MIKLTERFIYILAVLISLSGCSSADLLNFTIPSSGYSVHKDIAYGEDKQQKLDIYVPDKIDASKSVIIFFHGGSWQKGSKDDYLFVGQAFASKGFITVIADYRLYPQVYFPAFVEDSARAFVWTHQHIAQYGGDAQELFIAGHSAGGHIAAMLTLDGHYIKDAGGKDSWIRGTIGIAGPYDFLPFTDPKIKALFSSEADEKTQPVNFVHAGLPPMLLLYGDADTEVGLQNITNLTAKLRQFNDPVTRQIYPGVGHIGIILALANGFRSKAPVLEDISAFVHAQNKPAIK